MPTPITTISISHQKVDVEADYRTLISGLQAEASPSDPLLIGGRSAARADVITQLQARIDALTSTKTARAALQQAVASERAVDAVARPLRADVKVYLQGKYGRNNPILQSFGFNQARKGKPTVETKAAAHAKAKATRAALGTKGKQQKKAAKKAEQPAPITVTPNPTPAPAPSAAPSPSPSPSPSTGSTPAPNGSSVTVATGGSHV